jgi:hypothetical protein
MGATAGFGEQHPVVVRTVDVILVVEAADAVEAHQTGAAVGRDVGRIEDEGVPITVGDGNIRDEMLADGLGDLSLIGVDQRRLR